MCYNMFVMKKRLIQVIIVILFFALLLIAVFRMPKIRTTTHLSSVSQQQKEKDEPMDYNELSEKELIVLAYDGDKEAAFSLGRLYDYGLHGVEQSFSKALSWYSVADAANHPKAACALGYLYLNGCGVTKDVEVAKEYFNRAVAFGDFEGYVGLGRASIEKEYYNPGEAFMMFGIADENDMIDGYYYRGYLAEKGIGCEQDPALAIEKYKKVLETQEKDSDDHFAVDNANTRLGLMYLEGIGVEPDFNAAVHYLQAAANNHYAMAQYYLGIIYETGLGTDINYDEALRWFELAAEQDYAPALNQIGYMYFVGEGEEVNYEQALYYQKLAAALGYVKAQVNLGYIYENGYGVEQNLDTALVYYRMAESNGFDGAQEAIMRVGSLLDESAAITEAVADENASLPGASAQ